MSVDQHASTPPAPTNGADAPGDGADGSRYGNEFLLTDAPDHHLPQHGMPADDGSREPVGVG